MYAIYVLFIGIFNIYMYMHFNLFTYTNIFSQYYFYIIMSAIHAESLWWWFGYAFFIVSTTIISIKY